MIVGIRGLVGSGKDTVANMMIQYVIAKGIEEGSIKPGEFPGWEIKKFAATLKEFAGKLLGVHPSRFEDLSFKNSKLGPEWDEMTVREFLIRLGTEAMRDGLHKDVWVNALFATYTGRENWIITDLGFKNEYDRLKKEGAVLINVVRSNNPNPVIPHSSELEIQDEYYSIVIENDSDLESLQKKVNEISKQIFNIHQ